MTFHRPWHLLAIVLPVLVMCGWITSFLIHVEKSATYQLPIVGFDPRDLLSGHYIRYQVDYGVPIQCQKQSAPWCICLGTKGKTAYATSQGLCSELDCATPLVGKCTKSRFSAGIERFYFSEKFQKELAVVPPQSTIVVAIDSSGRGVVKDLLVDGVPVKEWLQQQ